MKETTPQNTRYVPLVQQKYCCVPACISMIMLKNNIPLISQELLGAELGLVVEEKDAGLFWKPIVGNPYPAGYGTNVGTRNEQIDLNIAFKKLNIPLKINFTYIDKFANEAKFTEYLQDIQDNNRDVLACFDWGTFSGKKEKQWGHVCVLDVVDTDKNEVRLIDPGYFEPKWEIVSISTLFEAMRIHTSEKGGGFWELTSV